MRPIIAIAAAALLAVTFFSTEASARMGGGGFHGGGFHGGGFHGGGFRGGFHGGFRGGFHRGFGFRHFGPRFAFGAPLRVRRLCGLALFLRLWGRLPGAAPHLDGLWLAHPLGQRLLLILLHCGNTDTPDALTVG